MTAPRRDDRLQGGHPSLLCPTSKSAIVSLHRAMAAHHGRDGIRVNAIVPGTVFQTPHPEELVFEWRVNDVFVTTFS